MVKNPAAKAGDARDVGLIPGSGRSPGGGNGITLQYSCLESSMDGGTWQTMVHGATESDTAEHTEYSIATPRKMIHQPPVSTLPRSRNLELHKLT